MKGFIETLQNIWKIEELKKRILTTLLFLLIFRIGSYIVLPGIDSAKLAGASNAGGGLQGLGDLLALFTGGAYTRASIFALGIMPYISASIVMQLMGLAVPAVQKMQKDGESGRKKLNQYTRFLTIAITIVQAPGYLATSVAPEAIINNGFWSFIFPSVVILTAGTLFMMWLGEKITDKGIGNGISLLIMIGIIADLPRSFIQEIVQQTQGGGGFVMLLLELTGLLVVIGATVLLVQGVRRVPVQYAKRMAGPSNQPVAGVRQYLPLKVNSSGVMPIIFAQALMFVPFYIGSAAGAESSSVLVALTDFNGLWYNLLFFFMVVIFTYFYTAIVVNPNQMADDLKRNGGFIPGIKPGRSTADFIDTLLSRITLPGSVFLALVAILPAIVMNLGLVKIQGFAIFYGGTSLLIMVGVILDTLQQIESHLLSRHYDGLMKSGKIQGRAGASAIAG